MTFKIEDITPRKAALYLLKNTQNRNLSTGAIAAYAHDMKHGHFALTHQGIAFFEGGTLADGQNRLAAVIKSGVIVRMVVCRGMSFTPYLDILRPRSISDCCKIAGDDWITKSVVAVVGIIRPSSGKAILSVVRETANTYMNEIIAAGAFVGTRRKKGVSHSAVYGAAVLYLIHGGDNEHVETLYRVLYSGIAETKQEQIILKLRDFLMLAKISGSGEEMRRNINYRTQRVLQALDSNEVLTRLHMPDDPIYPCVS